ncbi:MAG: hypothetical protein HXX09_04320 [Bacteroidetes bacterium]|nr:hypothetical protein [Bacteroidota bacterium]
MKTLKFKHFYKFVFSILLLNVFTLSVNAQADSKFLNNKDFEEAVMANRKVGLSDMNGLFSNYEITINKIEISSTDSIEVYNNLINIPGAVSCKLEFSKQTITFKIQKEMKNENFSRIKEELVKNHVGAIDYVEKIYKN